MKKKEGNKERKKKKTTAAKMACLISCAYFPSGAMFSSW